MERPIGQIQTAYKFIREKILMGELPPGQLLTTPELAKQIGVSRTPVRDALLRLEGEGLVTIQPNMSAAVRSLSVDEYREHCGLRLALEAHTASEAARLRRASDLREIEAHFNLLKDHCLKIASAKSVASHARMRSRHDIFFHVAIAEAARNQLLKSEIMRLCVINRFAASETLRGDWEILPEAKLAASMQEESVSANMDRLIREHSDILEAIRAQDEDAARIAMKTHLQRVINSYDRMSMAEHQQQLADAFGI